MMSTTRRFFLLLSLASTALIAQPPVSPLQRIRTTRAKRQAILASQGPSLTRNLRPRALMPRVAFDTSGNAMLNCAYFARQLLLLADPNTSAITRAVSIIGTMTFDGKGAYSFNGQQLDSSKSATTPAAFTVNGTYSVSSSGLLQMTNPVDSNDTEYGGVGGSGQVVASATEGQYDDLFVAIPAGPASALQGSYQAGFIDFLQANASNVRDGYFTLATAGSGSFGNVTVTGAMANQNSTKATQTLNNVTYTFNGSTGTLTFPSTPNAMTALVSGAKTFAVSTDGNTLLGGSPSGFDMFIAVKSASSATNAMLNGTYFTGALQNDGSQSVCDTPACVYSQAGSIAANGQGAGTQHQRVVGFSFSAYDLTTDYHYNFPSTGTYNDGATQLMLGANGAALLQAGSGNFYTLEVAFQAKQNTASGTSLNPLGVVNAASCAPITHSVAPGEYVAVFGSNLASTAQAPKLPLGTSLGGSQLKVNGTASPLYATSPGLVTGIIPNGTPAYDLAAFQVNNSNTVTIYTASTAPGVYTSTANGIGPADLFHLDFSYVTQSKPAAPSETLILYATGLGATDPVVSDGAAAPTPAAVVTDQGLYVDVYDSQGNVTVLNVTFAGLVPGLAGVYQLNVEMPASGIASGVGYIEIGTTDALTSEALIYVK